MNTDAALQKSIRRWMVFFIACLLLSGITAFGIETGLHWICSWWPAQNIDRWRWNAFGQSKQYALINITAASPASLEKK